MEEAPNRAASDEEDASRLVGVVNRFARPTLDSGKSDGGAGRGGGAEIELVAKVNGASGMGEPRGGSARRRA